MLSLRAFARSAPRTLSRITSTTTRASIRPALQSTLRPSRIATTQLCRAFTTTPLYHDTASAELAAKLANELSLEHEDNLADSDSNMAAFFDANPDWSAHDEAGTQQVLLTRQYEDETITVAFSIADFNSPMMESEEADEALEDEEEGMVEEGQSGGASTKGAVNQGRTSAGNIKVAPEDSVAPADREELRSEEDEEGGQGEPAFPANIYVLVQRAGKVRHSQQHYSTSQTYTNEILVQGALRMNLIADNGVFTIQSVTHLPDSKDTSSKTAGELVRPESTPETLYTGPPFQQLDEEVQSLLEQYLDARGINTALALFIPEYIDVKEQREYVGWLERVRGFVE